jgi:hypothetical protein
MVTKLKRWLGERRRFARIYVVDRYLRRNGLLRSRTLPCRPLAVDFVPSISIGSMSSKRLARRTSLHTPMHADPQNRLSFDKLINKVHWASVSGSIFLRGILWSKLEIALRSPSKVMAEALTPSSWMSCYWLASGWGQPQSMWPTIIVLYREKGCIF